MGRHLIWLLLCASKNAEYLPIPWASLLCSQEFQPVIQHAEHHMPLYFLMCNVSPRGGGGGVSKFLCRLKSILMTLTTKELMSLGIYGSEIYLQLILSDQEGSVVPVMPWHSNKEKVMTCHSFPSKTQICVLLKKLKHFFSCRESIYLSNVYSLTLCKQMSVWILLCMTAK